MTLQYSRGGVRIGAVAPSALVLPLTGDGTFNFSSVTSADIFLRRPDGEELQMTSVPITSQSATGLTLTYLWQAGDLSQTGKWAVYARLYVSGGYVDSDPAPFPVLDHYEPVIRGLPP